MSMWLTPSSTARRSTVIDRSRSLGAPRLKAALPVRRIAPNPTRLTVRSPSFQVPAAAAAAVCEVVTRRGPSGRANEIQMSGGSSG
ncbi:hypothetical protein ACFQX6_10635 [Streptosporangium lutulentum]